MSQRQRVQSGSPYEGFYGFSRAVRVGDRVVVAGTAPIWPGNYCNPDPSAQAYRCLELIIDALKTVGASAEDVVRTRMYLTDSRHADEIGRVHKQVLGAAAPAATMVVVASLLDPRWVVEIEAEAIVGD